MVVFVVAVVFLGLAVHPFLTYPLTLKLLCILKQRRTPRANSAQLPLTFSVCMSAYNERAVIAEKARNLLELRRRDPGLQVLVYVDGATDGTADELAAFRDKMTIVVGAERHGKSFGMRQLAALATGDILVFTDANVMIAPQAVAPLRGYFADSSIGCVCGTLDYQNAAASETSAVNSQYWRQEEHIKNLESELGSVMGADGSLFAIRRSLYPEVPDDIIDDFYVSMSVLCDGHRVIRAGDVQAYELSVVDRREEFRRKVRIACQAFNVHRLMWPRISRLRVLPLYCYVSHKLLRWLAAGNLTIAGLLFVTGLSLTLGPIVTALGLGSAMLGAAIAYRAGFTPVRKAYEIWLALLSTFIGVLRSLRGDRFQTWAPAQSIRSALPGATLATAGADSPNRPVMRGGAAQADAAAAP